MKIPSLEDVEGRKSDRCYSRVRDLLEAGSFKDHGPYVDRLLDAGHTPTDIASALFHLLSKEEAREGETSFWRTRSPIQRRPHMQGVAASLDTKALRWKEAPLG